VLRRLLGRLQKLGLARRKLPYAVVEATTVLGAWR
jgi:hypothetical protein